MQRDNMKNLLEECIDFITRRISLASVKILSQEYEIAPNLFCYYFRKVTGKPFKRFVLEKKLDLAKFMLVNTEKSVSEIARELGYSDVSNFTHFFKRLTGMSPLEYKRKHSDGKNL